jgi:cellulose synthase/poly-beta-1,6-N-acetylglucosamine synthase-like glycosyltransferase
MGLVSRDVKSVIAQECSELRRHPRISVVIPSRNELRRLPAVLVGVEAQVLIPDEVIIADGMSEDGSREWLARAAESRSWLKVIDSPRRTIPAALNAALDIATGDLVARMDTHADYSPSYLQELVRLLVRNDQLVGAGGAMESAGHGPWGRAIAATLRRPFGMGGAGHRVGGPAGPVEHVFTGCYWRDALLAVGGFDERLLANEDFELDARLRKRGGVIWLHPGARSTWYVPESLPALARKMLRYGRYKALTLRLHPSTVRARQLAPALLISGLVGLTLWRPRRGAAVAAAYLGLAGAAGAGAAAADGASPWRGALVPPVVHLAWGSGLLAGLVRFAHRPGAEGRLR